MNQKLEINVNPEMNEVQNGPMGFCNMCGMPCEIKYMGILLVFPDKQSDISLVTCSERCAVEVKKYPNGILQLAIDILEARGGEVFIY